MKMILSSWIDQQGILSLNFKISPLPQILRTFLDSYKKLLGGVRVEVGYSICIKEDYFTY